MKSLSFSIPSVKLLLETKRTPYPFNQIEIGSVILSGSRVIQTIGPKTVVESYQPESPTGQLTPNPNTESGFLYDSGDFSA